MQKHKQNRILFTAAPATTAIDEKSKVFSCENMSVCE
jgi:hypothetical protein